MNEFHFLRPWWLVAFVPILLVLWGLWRKSDVTLPWRSVIAPHLLSHLVVGKQQRSRTSPLVWLLVSWGVGALALAGPTWRREPAPFADDTTALAIVLKVTPSMQTSDVQPTRLARAVEKIHDLLALRPGSKTALIAYSGSAHLVMPLTTDAGTIDSFAGDLEPSVLPTEGDVAARALQMGSDVITKSGQRGWVLWIADGVANDQLPVLAEYQQHGEVPVSVLAVAGDGPEFASLQAAVSKVPAELIRVTPDDHDLQQLTKHARYSHVVDGTGERWQDAGYWLLPALALLALVWFRRGWVLPTGAAT